MKWRCLVCNYIHEGDSPPDECPVCGAPKEKFVLVTDEKVAEKPIEILDDMETEVLVVGTGVAGLVSAITAKISGLDVRVIEKGPVIGGTSARSGGRYWIPNNDEQKKVGIEDDRDAAIRYMSRYAFPAEYNVEKDNYGIPKENLELIETYYDTGSEVLNFLEGNGVLESELDYSWKGKPNNDYMDSYKENQDIRGRTLRPKTEKKYSVTGYDYVEILSTWLENNDVIIDLDTRAIEILLDEDGKKVVGIKAQTKDGIRNYMASDGVIFGTGGFSHNKELIKRFQYGPQYGGCAIGTNTGDLVNMSEKIGVKLGNMQNAYRNQSLYEEYLDNPTGVNSIFYIVGDSNFQVNKYGKRVMNEKRNYNDRGLVHFQWDINKGEWPNEFLFWIMDERNVVNWEGFYPLNRDESGNIPYVIRGDTIEELAENIEKRLFELKDNMNGYALDEKFKENLNQTLDNFNGFAKKGIDEEFNRGRYDYDLEFFTFPPINPKGVEWPPKNSKNVSMYPLKPPFYAFILASGKLDTNGGPIVNKDGQMIRYDGKAIEGLYGAGNCIASAGIASYWGAGATLGSAMVFGYRSAKDIINKRK